MTLNSYLCKIIIKGRYKAIEETKRRRTIQEKYNEVHHIVPQTIKKEIKEVITNEIKEKSKQKAITKKEKDNIIHDIEIEMQNAAKNLDFERAMELRDILFEMKSE